MSVCLVGHTLDRLSVLPVLIRNPLLFHCPLKGFQLLQQLLLDRGQQAQFCQVLEEKDNSTCKFFVRGPVGIRTHTPPSTWRNRQALFAVIAS